MAVSYTEGIRIRKKVIDNLYRQLKKADNRLEKSERFLKRVKGRKRVVPEDTDLVFLEKELRVVVSELERYQAIIRQGW